MAFAWLPKATVQAALGPIFLDNVKKLTELQWQSFATTCLTNKEEEWASLGHTNETITEEGMDWGTFSSECSLEMINNRWLGIGNDILTLAVLSILITAPLGAVAILALGPKLLESDQEENQADQDIETESKQF